MTTPSTPSQEAAVPEMTDEEIHRAWLEHGPRSVGNERVGSIIAFAHAIESRVRAASASPAPSVQPPEEKELVDLRDTLNAIFAAVGYTEEYARQFPKEKASVTFKRWFDEQLAKAAAGVDSPAAQAVSQQTPEAAAPKGGE